MITTATDPIKISVVIPVYNVKDYLEEAVNSILEQTITPYEVIIVNDGSTDGSGDILEEKYGFLDIVKIIHTENHGLGEARNEGSRHVTGDFIYYFDSDDIAVSTLIESFVSVFEKNTDLDIFCFSANSFFDAGQSLNRSLPFYTRKINKLFPNGVSAFNAMSKYGVFYPNAWMYVFRRSIVIDNNIIFKPIIHEDEEFTPRLFFCAGKVAVSTNILFKRRVRSGSIMQTSRSERNVIGYIESINSLEKLREITKNSKAKKNIKRRIETNIVSIMEIVNVDKVVLNDEVSTKFSRLIEKNSSLSLYLAEHNLSLYKLFFSVRIRLERIVFFLF